MPRREGPGGRFQRRRSARREDPTADERSRAAPRASRRPSRSWRALRGLLAPAGGAKDLLDLLVAGGGEIVVPEPDGMEGLGRRSASTAARMVTPVARPSSTSTTVRPATSGGGRSLR